MSQNSDSMGNLFGKNDASTDKTDPKNSKAPISSIEEPHPLSEPAASAVQPSPVSTSNSSNPAAFNPSYTLSAKYSYFTSPSNANSLPLATQPLSSKGLTAPSGPPSVPSPTFSPLSPTGTHPNTRMQTDLMRALEKPFPNPNSDPNKTIRDSDFSHAAPTDSIPIPNVSGKI